MKSIKFKESTIELKKPKSMTDEQCSGLHVYQNTDGSCISCWTASFWDRVKFLFHGKIWLGVHSGKTQPPVWLDCTKTVFIKDKRMSSLEFVNRYFFQWLYFRLYFEGQVINNEFKIEKFGLLYWIVPKSGWTNEYKVLGEKMKRLILHNKKKQNQCYKGYGPCDCSGTCRENC